MLVQILLIVALENRARFDSSVFGCLIYFQLTEENVFSVLCFADVYLLNGLKRLCARVIANLLDNDNVVTVLKTARLFNQPKLEADCCEFIGKNLDKVRTNIQRFA